MATSKVINAVVYNPERMDLKLTFVGGKEYVYTPVSYSFYDEFVSSKSEGKFFNRNIKNNMALTCLKVVK